MRKGVSRIEWMLEQEQLLRSGREADGGLGVVRPVSDRKFVERALLLANLNTWTDLACVYAWFALGHGTVEYQNDALPTAMAGWFSVDEWRSPELWSEYQREKQTFNEVLKAIQLNLPGARKQYQSTIARQLSDVLCVGFVTFQNGQLQDRARPYLQDLGQAWAYAAALLLDGQRRVGKLSLGERLRRCAHGQDEDVPQPCRKWFLSFASEDGGPMPKYCSAECRLMSAAGTAAVRQRRARKRRMAK